MKSDVIDILCKRCPSFSYKGVLYGDYGNYCGKAELKHTTARIESSLFIVPITCPYYMEMVVEGEKVADK